MTKLINTQERRWEHVLDGYMLITTNSSGEENVVGIFQGELYNFTLQCRSDLNLSDSERVTYSLEMKNNKIRKYLYVWGFTDKLSYGFHSETELAELKRIHIGCTFTKHENAWTDL